MKLADFGLAKHVVRPVFTVCGTPTYVAPEILSEKGKCYISLCGVLSHLFTNVLILVFRIFQCRAIKNLQVVAQVSRLEFSENIRSGIP